MSAREILHQSESNEWYTPALYTDAARELMGGIDLDPASTEVANRTVRASRFYTIEDDGLALPWQGRVWLNPPYGKTDHKSNAERWSARLLEEYAAGRVTEAILLVNAVPGNAWFTPLKGYARCEPRRIQFLDPTGNQQKGATHSNALIYFGPNVAAFRAVFSRLGHVQLPSEPAPQPPAATIDTGHAVVINAARRLHVEVVSAKGEVGAGLFKLGRCLHQMRESRAHTALGYATFEEYLAGDDVALHRATAYRCIRTYRLYGDVVHGRHWMQSMDLRKLDILARLIDEDTDPEVVADLAEQAREMPREELRQSVQAEAQRRGVLPPEERAQAASQPVRLVRKPSPVAIPQTPPAPPSAIVVAVETDSEYERLVLSGEVEKVADKLREVARLLRGLEEVGTDRLTEALGADRVARLRREFVDKFRPALGRYADIVGEPLGALKRVK